MSHRKRKSILIIGQPPVTAHFCWRARLSFYFYGNGFTFSVRHRELYLVSWLFFKHHCRRICLTVLVHQHFQKAHFNMGHRLCSVIIILTATYYFKAIYFQRSMSTIAWTVTCTCVYGPLWRGITALFSDKRDHGSVKASYSFPQKVPSKVILCTS